jgi:hypothetical protein
MIQPQTRTLKAGQASYKLPAIICGVLIGVYALFFVYRVGAMLLFPYPWEYGEGTVFYEASRLSEDGFRPYSLYLSNAQFPYEISNYSPMHYYLSAIIMLFTGTRSILGVRLVSVLGCIGIGLVIYYLTRREEMAKGQYGSRYLALAAALTPFAIEAFYHWGMLAKPDALGLAFTLAGAGLTWRTRGQPEKVRLYLLAGLCCVLGLYSKQSFVAAPVAIIIWLGLRRQWRGLGIFLAVMAGLGGSIALFFQITTSGNFYKHVVSYNNGQESNFDILAGGLRYFLLTHLILISLLVWRVVDQFRKRNEGLDFWLIYFLAAFAVSFTVIKVGSAINYYMESLALLAMLGWWQIGKLLAHPAARQVIGSRIKISLGGLLLLYMALQLLALRHIPVIYDGNLTPAPNEWQQAQQVSNAVKELGQQGTIFPEESGYLALHGLKSEIDDPFAFGQLQHNGQWDDHELINRLQSGYYRTAFYYIDQAPDHEAELDQLIKDCKAWPLESRYDPKVFQILTDCTKYKPFKRIGPWLFLAWNG